VNEFFFLPDPDHLIATHLPDDPAWQLLEPPVSFQQFEDAVYLRDRFFQLGLSLTDQRLQGGVQATVGGQAVISLRMPAERSAKYDFRYLLFKSRHSTSDSQVPTYPVLAKLLSTRSSATADGPRDALPQSRSCQLLHSVGTSVTTNLQQIEILELAYYGRRTYSKLCTPTSIHDALTVTSVVKNIDRRRHEFF